MNDIQHFSRLIKDIKFAMFTTLDQSTGALCSRPMTLQQNEFDGNLWFFSAKSSELVKQVSNNAQVNLAFSNVKTFSFLSAQGKAQVLVDKEKQEELWNPLYKAWFPEGLEDPDLCLIKVSVENADYWESPDSKLVRFVGFTQAILTGKKANPALGKHGHLNMQ